MKVRSVKTILELVLDMNIVAKDLYIELPGHLPFGFCLDDLSNEEAVQILIDAGRSASVQKAIIAEIKNLLEANGHEVDWEG